MNHKPGLRGWFATVLAGLLLAAGMVQAVQAQPVDTVLELAKKEKAPLLESLRDLCNIESGSRDPEGLGRIAELIATRLKSLGGDVQLVDVGADVYKMEDTPQRLGQAVRATSRARAAKASC